MVVGAIEGIRGSSWEHLYCGEKKERGFRRLRGG